MIKIRRKRLFEDDATTNNGQQPAAQPQQNNTQPAAQPAQPAVPNNQQPQQNTNNQQQNQQPDQNQQQQNQNQQQEQQPNPVQQSVQELLKQFENIYVMVANSVPDMIKEKIADFKPDNQQAAPVIKLWDAFKAQPSEQTFNAFIDGFKAYGSVSEDQNQQQQQTQQNESRITAYNFTKALNERLQRARYMQMTQDYLKQ